MIGTGLRLPEIAFYPGLDWTWLGESDFGVVPQIPQPRRSCKGLVE